MPVETDLSVFLSFARNPVIAVTGTKGKSTTASAIHHGLLRVSSGARLGGNITVSPLEFLDELAPADPVVLELSSWQLGDLAGRGLLAPAISVLTVLLPDHLDRYPGMDAYVEDKKAIFREQGPGQRAVFNRDDPRQAEFHRETRAEPFWYSAAALPADLRGAWLEGPLGKLRTGPGADAPHGARGLAPRGRAQPDEPARRGPGPVAARGEGGGDRPGPRGVPRRRAPARAVPRGRRRPVLRRLDRHDAPRRRGRPAALEAPVVLVAGGTDKGLDYAPLAAAARGAAAVVLLAGTATDKLRPLLEAGGIPYEGPFDALDPAVSRAVELAGSLRAGGPAGTPVSVVLSPGCASFGMFQNEFDRGRRFKEAVRRLAR